MNETIETKVYGICPIHNEESYFTYIKTRNEMPIYECGRCQEELSLFSILKVNKYVVRTNKKLNHKFKE